MANFVIKLKEHLDSPDILLSAGYVVLANGFFEFYKISYPRPDEVMFYCSADEVSYVAIDKDSEEGE